MLGQFRTILASGETYRKIAATLAKTHAPMWSPVYFEGTDTVAHLFMKFRPPQLPNVSRERPRISAHHRSVLPVRGRAGGGARREHGRRQLTSSAPITASASDRDRPVTSDC